MARKPGKRSYGNCCHKRLVVSVALDPYIIDTLMADLVGHDRQPSAYLVYLALARRALGVNHTQVAIALQDIAEATGLSKRTVQSALAHLAYRRCITVERASVTAVPTYTVLRPWRRGA
jgi:hypothetical protein